MPQNLTVTALAMWGLFALGVIVGTCYCYYSDNNIDAKLEQASQKYHLPMLDLYRSSGINKINYVTYLRDQTIDGLHPYLDVGHQKVADSVASAFSARF